MVYCLRYVNNLQRIPSERISSRLTVAEIRIAHMQANAFAGEIAAIKKNSEPGPANNIWHCIHSWTINTCSGWTIATHTKTTSRLLETMDGRVGV